MLSCNAALLHVLQFFVFTLKTSMCNETAYISILCSFKKKGENFQLSHTCQYSIVFVIGHYLMIV